MIKEFAVDPRVMATWAHFQSLFEDFGVGKGRLIARYPNDWAQEVQKLARQLSPPVRASTIATKVFDQKHKFIPPRRPYDQGKPWLVNAEDQMAEKPFDAVIAERNPRRHPNVLVAGEFDKGASPYCVEVQQEIPRTPEALAECARLLLSVCHELQVVDPHFDPAERRFIKPFEAILAICDSASPLKKLEIHTQKKSCFDRGNREYHFTRAFADNIPAGITLRVFFWQQRPSGKPMHPRFLLTDLGGLQYDYGLDEGENQGETTIVTLMDHSLFLQARADYTDSSLSFDITPDSIIDIPGRG